MILSTRIRIMMVCLLGMVLAFVPALGYGEWRKPLGPIYTGPEGQPRSIVAVPAKLSTDELATIRVFEKATQSVVYITNTAIRRDFWSLNTFEVPQGAGSGVIWERHG